MRAKIIGTGSCLPDRSATNDYLSTIMDTSDQWIHSRTGIHKRHLVSSEEETTLTLAVNAANAALEDAGILPAQLDLILVATVSSDFITPSTACMVQKALGACHATAFDINAACSGFLFALNTVDAYFQSGACQTALIIGVETLSKIIDWSDRSTCVLFGDGAGAVVAKASEEGMVASIQGSDGTGGDILICKNRTNNNPYIATGTDPGYLSMNGQEVFKFAVKKVPECIQSLLAQTGLCASDVTYYLLHQANYRIITSIARKLKLPIEKFPSNVERCGNTSAASIPILLDEVHKEGKLSEGDILLLSGFGAGLTWGAALLKW
ncbi:MAG: ketoacyl-ACP synthase III [Lachnospiraceae bacterium]|jgi:3-oxoacyl-[acyl-carrier-protein] synthase-3|nr:ketoacyl-ACP synthase III [Lachnospiraceae bacterium]